MPVMKPDTLAGGVGQAGGLQDLGDAVEQPEDDRVRGATRGRAGPPPAARRAAARRWRCANRTARKSSVGTRSSRSLIRKNVDAPAWRSCEQGASGGEQRRTPLGAHARRPRRAAACSSGMSALPGSREPGVSRTNGTPGGRRVREQLARRRRSPMWPSPIRWCRSLKAPRTSIESLACTRRSRPGTADLDDPVHGRRRAAGLVERCAGREDVAGVEADPGLAGGGRGRRGRARGPRRRRTASGPARRSARAAATGRRRRPAPPARAAAPRGPVASRRRTARRPRGPSRVDERAGVHDDALGADLDRAAQVVGDGRPRTARRSTAVGEPRLTRYGAWMKARMPRCARCRRGSARPRPACRARAPSRGGCRRRPGGSRSRSSSALASAPATRPLPTGTWVPIGLRAAWRSVGHGRTLSVAEAGPVHRGAQMMVERDRGALGRHRPGAGVDQKT